MALVVILILTACSTTPPPKNGDLETSPPITSKSPEIQAQFDAALALIEEGRWAEAVEAFRLLQAEHSDDETAALAELLIGRALLGDLDEYFEAQGTDDEADGERVDQEVFGLLEPLSVTNGVDDRIRYAAQAYLAVAHVINRDVEQGLEILGSYPGASMSPMVLEFDRRWLWPLIAEGLGRAERHGASVIAWGRLHALLRDEAAAAMEVEDEDGQRSQVDQSWPDEESYGELGTLAVARAFEAEPYLTNEQVQRFLSDDEPLVRAVGAWTFIRAQIGSRVDEETVQALQTVFNETAPAFLTILAADRASELSAALASVSGPDRLVIGALLPLSGPNRAVGYRALAGMLVAQRSFHVAGQPSITLIIEDSRGDVVAAYHRLVEEGVLAVVGPVETAQARLLIEPSSQRGVPVLAMTTDRIITEAYQPSMVMENREDGEELVEEQDLSQPPIFRNFVNAIAEARAAAVLSFEVLGDRRAAVVYPDMGYGRAMSAAFSEEFRRLGGEVVASVAYDRQGTDYVDTARAVARSRPDAIFLPDTGAKVAEVTAFLAQENIWGLAPDGTRPTRTQRQFVHYLGTSLWQDQTLLHQASSYVQGALVPAWYSSVFSDGDTRRFTGSFDAIYGRRADHFEAFAYDSINRIRSLLLDRGLPDGQALAEALRSDGWTQGATGRYRFGSDGEPHRQLRYLVIEDREWSVYEHQMMTPMSARSDSDDDLDGQSLEELDAERSDEDDSRL